MGHICRNTVKCNIKKYKTNSAPLKRGKHTKSKDRQLSTYHKKQRRSI